MSFFGFHIFFNYRNFDIDGRVSSSILTSYLLQNLDKSSWVLLNLLIIDSESFAFSNVCFFFLLNTRTPSVLFYFSKLFAYLALVYRWYAPFVQCNLYGYFIFLLIHRTIYDNLRTCIY